VKHTETKERRRTEKHGEDVRAVRRAGLPSRPARVTGLEWIHEPPHRHVVRVSIRSGHARRDATPVEPPSSVRFVNSVAPCLRPFIPSPPHTYRQAVICRDTYLKKALKILGAGLAAHGTTS